MVLSENIVTALYIAASVLFILSLGGLSGQESAKRAVWYGIFGMADRGFRDDFQPCCDHYIWLVAFAGNRGSDWQHCRYSG